MDNLSNYTICFFVFFQEVSPWSDNYEEKGVKNWWTTLL